MAANCILNKQIDCSILLWRIYRHFFSRFRRGRKSPGVRRRWLPIAYCLLTAGVFVVLEFALNGKIPIPQPVCYGVMIAGMAALGLNESWAFHRMEKVLSRTAV